MKSKPSKKYRLLFPSDGATVFISTDMIQVREWKRHYGPKTVVPIKSKSVK